MDATIAQVEAASHYCCEKLASNWALMVSWGSAEIHAGPVGALKSAHHGKDYVGFRCVVADDRIHVLQSVSEAFGLMPRRWVKRYADTHA